MASPRAIALGVLGAVFAAAGFLIGHSLGGESAEPELGSLPATLTIERSDVKVPEFASGEELPPLAATTTQVSAETGGESESSPETNTVTPILKEEKKAAPPKSSPQPQPGITVGGSEE